MVQSPARIGQGEVASPPTLPVQNIQNRMVNPLNSSKDLLNQLGLALNPAEVLCHDLLAKKIKNSKKWIFSIFWIFGLLSERIVNVVDDLDPPVDQFHSWHREMGCHGVDEDIRDEVLETAGKDQEVAEPFEIPRKKGVVV